MMLLGLSSCGDDDEEDDDVEPTTNLTITGTDGSPDGTSTFLIRNDQIVLNIGSDNPLVVMQFTLPDGETQISTGTYTATSAFNNDESLVYLQYAEGFDIYYAQGGTVVIDEATATVLSGTIDADLESNAGDAIEINGAFSAVPQ